MINPLHQLGAISIAEESRQKAERAILAHDPKAHDIVEMLLGEKE